MIINFLLITNKWTTSADAPYPYTFLFSHYLPWFAKREFHSYRTVHPHSYSLFIPANFTTFSRFLQLPRNPNWRRRIAKSRSTSNNSGYLSHLRLSRALRLHPDKGGDPELFKEVTHACVSSGSDSFLFEIPDIFSATKYFRIRINEVSMMPGEKLDCLSRVAWVAWILRCASIPRCLN